MVPPGPSTLRKQNGRPRVTGTRATNNLIGASMNQQGSFGRGKEADRVKRPTGPAWLDLVPMNA